MATFRKTNNPNAVFGEESPSVLALQKELNAQGANLAEDSKFGPKTQAAVDSSNQSRIDTANEQRNSNTVNSRMLDNTRKEVELPEAQPEMESANLIDKIETENQTAIDRRAEQVQTDKGEAVSDIEQLMLDIAGGEAQQGKFNEQFGVAGFEDQAAEFESAIALEARSLKNAKERLMNDPNLVGSVRDRIITEETRRSTSRAADLAILRDVASGDADRARARAKEKVDAELAPMKAELEAKKFVLEQNSDIWNATEKAQLDQDIKAEERAYDEQKEEKEKIEDLKVAFVENGGDPKEFSGKDFSTFDEALEVMGSGLQGANNETLKLDNGNTLLINKQTGKIIKNFGGSESLSGKGGPAGAFDPLISITSALENTVAGKKAVATQLKGFIQAENYDAAYDQIANTVAQGLPAENRNRFISARIDTEVLSGLKDAVQAYSDAGGDMGLLKGKQEEIRRKLGNVKDPALTALAVQLQREFQTYRNVMTGAAFTPEESREYASVNPTTKKSLDLNLAVIDGALNQLNNRVEGTINAVVPQAQELADIINIPKEAAKENRAQMEGAWEETVSTTGPSSQSKTETLNSFVNQ